MAARTAVQTSMAITSSLTVFEQKLSFDAWTDEPRDRNRLRYPHREATVFKKGHTHAADRVETCAFHRFVL